MQIMLLLELWNDNYSNACISQECWKLKSPLYCLMHLHNIHEDSWIMNFHNKNNEKKIYFCSF